MMSSEQGPVQFIAHNKLVLNICRLTDTLSFHFLDDSKTFHID